MTKQRWITFIVIVLAAVALAAVTQTDWVTQIKNAPFLDSRTYDFTPRQPGGTLTGGNAATVTMPSPGCPLGFAGANTNHYIYVYDGTGTDEAVLITGGTCTSGASSGTIQFTPANNHSGAWKIRSASDGVQEAIWAAASTGDTIMLPAVVTAEQKVTIGTGSGTTQSTRKGIHLVGRGQASANTSFTSGTLWTYAGPDGGTAIRIQGPIQGVEINEMTIDGNSLADIAVDILACAQCGMSRVTIRELDDDGFGIRMDAVADFNGNTFNGTYRDLVINADASGSSCIYLGPTNLNFNAGTFRNAFYSIHCSYANDEAPVDGGEPGSHGVILGWADNNVFLNFMMQAVAQPGVGSAINHIRQPAGSGNFDFLPSENLFILPALACPTCTGITGNSGKSIGTVFWPWQINDSAGLPTVKNVKGWLTNGEFFDTNGISRMAFQKLLNIINREGVAELDITGFLAPSLATGTISTVGAAVTGSGTSFTSAHLGKYIFATSEYRRITAVNSTTSVTIATAFTDDVPSGTSFYLSTGSSGFWFSDGNTNIGTFDATDVKIFTGNALQATFDSATMMFTNQGPIVGTRVDTALANAGGNTLTAAQTINGMIRRTGGGAQTDTTPTAAQLVAAIPNAQVGMTFLLDIYNNSSGLHTLALGTNVTIASGFTSVLTTTAAQRHSFVFRLENVTGSSEAISVFSNGQSAY